MFFISHDKLNFQIYANELYYKSRSKLKMVFLMLLKLF